MADAVDLGQLFVITFLPPIWPMINSKLEFEVKLKSDMIWVIENFAAKPPCKLQGEGIWIVLLNEPLLVLPPPRRMSRVPYGMRLLQGPPSRSWVWNFVKAYVYAFAIDDR